MLRGQLVHIINYGQHVVAGGLCAFVKGVIYTFKMRGDVCSICVNNRRRINLRISSGCKTFDYRPAL